MLLEAEDGRKFTVTVSGSSIGSISGDIPLDDGGSHPQPVFTPANPFKGTWIGIDDGGGESTVIFDDSTYETTGNGYKAKGTYTYVANVAQVTQTHMDFGFGWTTDGSLFGITLPFTMVVTITNNVLTTSGSTSSYTKQTGTGNTFERSWELEEKAIWTFNGNVFIAKYPNGKYWMKGTWETHEPDDLILSITHYENYPGVDTLEELPLDGDVSELKYEFLTSSSLKIINTEEGWDSILTKLP
jgi:hypothetical protein